MPVTFDKIKMSNIFFNNPNTFLFIYISKIFLNNYVYNILYIYLINKFITK